MALKLGLSSLTTAVLAYLILGAIALKGGLALRPRVIWTLLILAVFGYLTSLIAFLLGQIRNNYSHKLKLVFWFIFFFILLYLLLAILSFIFPFLPLESCVNGQIIIEHIAAELGQATFRHYNLFFYW